MKNNIKKIFYFSLLYLFCQYKINAQTEFLIRVNPNNGSFNIVNNLPNVNYIATYPNFTTYDQNSKRYIFKGKDFSNDILLYVVNATDGSIISNSPFPISSDDNPNKIYELQFDNSSNILYGLHWDNTISELSLININPNSGNFSFINNLPIQDPIATAPLYSQFRFSTFDSNNHKFIMSGKDINGNNRLFSIDANSGNVLSNPLFPSSDDSQDKILELQYDNLSNTLYGIFLDHSVSTFYLVSINQLNGAHTLINSIPNLQSIDTSNGYTTFDEINHRFIFRGLGSNGWSLFSINANNGQILSSPLFPSLLDSSDNIIEMQFDNLTGDLYALHWSNSILNTNSNNFNNKLLIYPNPINSVSLIQLDKIYEKVSVEIYNHLGQILKTEVKINTSVFELNRNDFLKGIYFVKVFVNNENIGIKKIIIE